VLKFDHPDWVAMQTRQAGHDGGDPNATSEQLSEEELCDLVSTHDALDEQEPRILSDVFAASETSVKEVMRPRGDVTFLAGHLTLIEAADRVRDLPDSRYPVTATASTT
jgi:putative hemolysin